MSEVNIPNVNLTEFTELQIEGEFNYIDLTQKVKKFMLLKINLV